MSARHRCCHPGLQLDRLDEGRLRALIPRRLHRALVAGGTGALRQRLRFFETFGHCAYDLVLALADRPLTERSLLGLLRTGSCMHPRCSACRMHTARAALMLMPRLVCAGVVHALCGLELKSVVDGSLRRTKALMLSRCQATLSAPSTPLLVRASSSWGMGSEASRALRGGRALQILATTLGKIQRRQLCKPVAGGNRTVLAGAFRELAAAYSSEREAAEALLPGVVRARPDLQPEPETPARHTAPQPPPRRHRDAACAGRQRLACAVLRDGGAAGRTGAVHCWARWWCNQIPGAVTVRFWAGS